MCELSDWMKGELDQCERAKAVGLHREIAHDTAAAGFRKAIERIKDLESEVAELQPVRKGR